MLRTKTADRIACVAIVFMLAASVCLWGLVRPGQGDGSHEIGYESLLFDTSRVHTIEITSDNWEDIINKAASEEYRECSIVIDGENLGITGYLYELDDIYPRLCLIPTQDGTIEWLDYFDRLNTLNVEKSVIYLFEADSQTGQITVTTKQPNEI